MKSFVRATARRATLVANPYSMTDAAPPSPDATWQLDSASGPCLLSAGELKGLKLLGRGKVRDLYQVDDERLLVVSTDRLSAFDVIMKNGVPGKGKILNQLTVFWLRHLERELGLKHHLITADVEQMPAEVRAYAGMLSGRSMLVRKLEMLPVEVIVRGYITGSGWVDYGRTGAVCGHVLPAGLQQCEKLPAPIFTPSTKAALGEHDENIDRARVAETIGAPRAEELEAAALKVYACAAALAAERGVLVADTKMEFGVDASGAMVLGDEALTPDCSRYWPKAGYETGRDQDSFDKQYVRNWLKGIAFDKKTPMALPDDVIANTLAKYTEIFKILTGADPVL